MSHKKTLQEELSPQKCNRRLKNLSGHNGRLSSLEEAVLRGHHGIGLKEEAFLPTHCVNDTLKHFLLRMELEAFEKSGRIMELVSQFETMDIDEPNAYTLELTERLKRK